MNNSDELKVLIFKGEVEHEDQKRRVMTRFAYRFADDWFTAFMRSLMVILGLQVMVVLAIAFAGGLPRGATSDPRSLLIFTPMVALPIMPFLIFKWRYARWGLLVLAALGGLSWLGLMLQDWIVSRLV
jgi:hypothetical protein